MLKRLGVGDGRRPGSRRAGRTGSATRGLERRRTGRQRSRVAGAAEPPVDQRAGGDRGAGGSGGGLTARGRLDLALDRLPADELPELGQNVVQPDALDVLHYVVVIAVVMSHTEDRHDVGVVQPGGRLGLALESLQLLRFEEQLPGQHLDRHPAAQRLLLGLVDDPHPAPADLANDAKIAQPFDPGRAERSGAVGVLLLADLELLHGRNRRKQLADLLRPLRVFRQVLVDRRVLAAPAPLDELGGQKLHGIAFGGQVGHE